MSRAADVTDPSAVTPLLFPVPRRIRVTDARVPDRAATERIDESLPAEGYRLVATLETLEVVGADPAGLAHARSTLSQLRAGARPGTLPEIEIDDHPDLAVRGVMLDVARGRVPTMGTLEAFVDGMASLKLNHLELYMEASFAFPDHPNVDPEPDPITEDELRRLDRYCRERHVELTANQNTLGHMERWLRHPRYQHLAATPEGWTSSRGEHEPATTLDPGDPKALTFARSLVEAIVPCVSSRRFHVGLDEPLDLDPAIWAALYGESGTADLLADGGFVVPLPPEQLEAYVAFLQGLRATPALREHELLMWGDVLAAHPEALDRVPAGVTVCEWGYESTHPFASRLGRLREASISAWVCPGTSSWSGVAGRARNAWTNIAAAARAGIEGGAAGLLVADWGNAGLASVAEAQVAAAAGVSWCLATNERTNPGTFGDALDRIVFADGHGRFGSSMLALGQVDADFDSGVPEVPMLALGVREPEAVARLASGGMGPDDVEPLRARIDAAHGGLGEPRLDRPDAQVLLAELGWAADALDVLARDLQARLGAGGRLEGVAGSQRRLLLRDLLPLIERRRALRDDRYRPGGRDDVEAALEGLVAAYSP